MLVTEETTSEELAAESALEAAGLVVERVCPDGSTEQKSAMKGGVELGSEIQFG